MIWIQRWGTLNMSFCSWDTIAAYLFGFFTAWTNLNIIIHMSCISIFLKNILSALSQFHIWIYAKAKRKGTTKMRWASKADFTRGLDTFSRIFTFCILKIYYARYFVVVVKIFMENCLKTNTILYTTQTLQKYTLSIYHNR